MEYSDEQIARFMRRAIALARDAMKDGRGGPFGAVVVRQGEVVGEGGNRVVRGRDPTAHAEIVAIRAAAQKLETHSLQGCDIFASCEPCPMCLSAIYWARIDRIWFSATRDDAAGAGFDDALILDELSQPTGARRIPMSQALSAEAREVMAEWRAHPDKVRY